MYQNLPQIRGKYRFKVNLAKMCWFGVGGNAAVIFTPSDIDDLIYFLQNKGDIPIFTFGVGSNILIRDGGFDGVVIRLGQSMNFIQQIDKDVIKVGASVLDQNVSNFAIQHSIGGLEFLSGIPGTVGGGLAMNAGAYGKEFRDIVMNVQAIDIDGKLISFTNQEMGFEYRSNSINKEIIFLSTELKGFECSQSAIIEKVEQIKTNRFDTQPVKGIKTGGSTFKNPDGLKAWKLIDEAGCRGFKIGGAEVSQMHCNFFINNGSATAKDIEDLIDKVQEKVFIKSGIMLQKELVILGKKIETC
jgi:UDP-N-acetylmuramate dehydrogenase